MNNTKLIKLFIILPHIAVLVCVLWAYYLIDFDISNVSHTPLAVEIGKTVNPPQEFLQVQTLLFSVTLISLVTYIVLIKKASEKIIIIFMVTSYILMYLISAVYFAKFTIYSSDSDAYSSKLPAINRFYPDMSVRDSIKQENNTEMKYFNECKSRCGVLESTKSAE